MKRLSINITILLIVTACFLYFANKEKAIFAYQYVDDYSEVIKFKNAKYLAEYELFDTQKKNTYIANVFWAYLKQDITGCKNKKCDDDSLLQKYGLEKNIWVGDFDLNHDGIPEIIGANDSVCCGSLMYCFRILQKNKFTKNYKNISYILFNKEFYKIRVLKNKTNNFYDLYLFSIRQNGDRILRYNKIQN